MQINFYLDTRSNTKNGHPIKIRFFDGRSQTIKSIKSYSEKKHWSNGKVNRSHPNFYIVQDKLENLSKKMRKAEQILTSNDKAVKFVFGEDSTIFYETALQNIKEQYTGRNAESYENALKRFQKEFAYIEYQSITKALVKSFLKGMQKDLKPSTAHTYLRKLDTLWTNTTDLKNPFKGIRPSVPDSPDKNLSEEDVIKIATTRTFPSLFNAGYTIHELNTNRKYWLLMFYLGGIDMFDLAKLRYDEHVVNGRIEFHRGKGQSRAFCSNLILPEALEILKDFDCKPYLVPIYMQKNYTSFVGNFNRRFRISLQDLKLTRRPLTKSARYTFINRAKNLLIDERITKQLVGHKDNSVHSIYSGRLPNDIVDQSLKKIIEIT